MNYGLPYQGSKNRIARRLVDALPPAPVLYDVFCGGCAVTHAAMLSGKYQHFVINDRRGWLPDAFQKAIHGGYAHEDRWISHEDFERLKNLECPQTDESLCRLQSLERLERINSTAVPPVLTVTTGDYRALEFYRPGIIYCDPPYKSTEERYGRDFDFDDFYAWCEHQANPVFISEYTMPEDRFLPVAAFTVTRKMDARKSSICPEKIWRPRTQL